MMNTRRIVHAAIASLLLVGVVPASAQVLSQRIPVTASGALSAITVTGRGTVHVPADRMRVVVHLFWKKEAMTQNVDVDALGKTVADVMRAHGVPDAAWVLPLNGMLGSPNAPPSIVGTVVKPTRPAAEAIVREIIKAMPDSVTSAVANVQVQTSLFIDDCFAAENGAEKAAFEDARKHAKALARAAGVKLGAVIAVTENGILPSACLPMADSNMNFNGSNDALGPVDVQIGVATTVSFAIR
jgi:uncharacterized protein YggE